LSESGAQLKSWNQTSSYCPGQTSLTGDGTVGTDSSGDVTLKTTGKAGSCVALISPGTYKSDVIEAKLYFPALPGKPGTIANWTACWLTDQANWPAAGELDGVEVEPVNATNDVTWHSGTTSAEVSASTYEYSPVKLPVEGADLTPGWHTVDIVYTKGFFAVYYDGQQYTSYTSSAVTGAALNLILTSTVTPKTDTAYNMIGGPAVNSASSPETMAVQYLRIWSYK